MHKKSFQTIFCWTVLIIALGGGAGLAVFSGQDASFDLLNYHFYSGFALLNKPFPYDFAPAQIQSFHNPALHVLSYAILAHFPAAWAAALLGAIQGLNFFLVFRITQFLFAGYRPAYRNIIGLACAATGFYGITTCTEIGSTFGDNLISILVLSSVLMLLRGLRQRESSTEMPWFFWLLAGFLAGTAFGLKLTAVMYAAAIAVAVPVILLRSPKKAWYLTGVLYCGIAAGFLLGYGFWAARLYTAYQNPVFPYMNQTFQSPYYDLSSFVDERFFPKNWQQTLFYPFYFARKNSLVCEVEFRDIRIALCYVAAALIGIVAVVRLLRRANAAAANPETHNGRLLQFLLLFLLVSYIAWLNLSSVYRYLNVHELLAPAFLAYACSRLIRKESFVVQLSLIINLAVIVCVIPISFGRQEFDDRLLKLQIPSIRHIEDSVIVMAGYEPTAYIAASFPASTRFVRVSGTFVTPGKNTFVDGMIRKILSGYDGRHVFVYVPNIQEIGQIRLDASRYGIPVDAGSCYEIRSGERVCGYLCGVTGAPPETEDKPVPALRYSPKFVSASEVRVSGSANGRFIDARINGLRAAWVDTLYEQDGELMPVIRHWPLESSGLLHLGPLSRTGTYRIRGIRDSGSPDPDLWTTVDCAFTLTFDYAVRPTN